MAEIMSLCYDCCIYSNISRQKPVPRCRLGWQVEKNRRKGPHAYSIQYCRITDHWSLITESFHPPAPLVHEPVIGSHTDTETRRMVLLAVHNLRLPVPLGRSCFLFPLFSCMYCTVRCVPAPEFPDNQRARHWHGTVLDSVLHSRFHWLG